MLAKYAANILLLFTVASLTSCTSQIPVATNYPYTEQQKMQAAFHWNTLAADVINRFKQNCNVSKDTPVAVCPKFYMNIEEDTDISEAEDFLTLMSEEGNTDIWVTQTPLAATFDFNWLVTAPFKRAYQNYLIEQLVNAGYNVVDNQAAAELLVIFDIQLVKHKERQVRRPHIISQVGRIIAGKLDGAYDGIKAGKYEAVITTAVKRGHSYLMCHVGTYYINAPYSIPPRWGGPRILYTP